MLNRGRVAEAIAELRRANTLQADMPETLLELGKALNNSGDAKSAEPYLQQVLKMERDSPLAESAHFQISQVYRKLGRPSDADRELKLFHELRSKHK